MDKAEKWLPWLIVAAVVAYIAYRFTLRPATGVASPVYAPPAPAPSMPPGYNPWALPVQNGNTGIRGGTAQSASGSDAGAYLGLAKSGLDLIMQGIKAYGSSSSSSDAGGGYYGADDGYGSSGGYGGYSDQGDASGYSNSSGYAYGDNGDAGGVLDPYA